MQQAVKERFLTLWQTYFFPCAVADRVLFYRSAGAGGNAYSLRDCRGCIGRGTAKRWCMGRMG